MKWTSTSSTSLHKKEIKKNVQIHIETLAKIEKTIKENRIAKIILRDKWNPGDITITYLRLRYRAIITKTATIFA